MIKNQIFKTAVTDMNNLGYGVCRIEDMVVFVDGAVDGDFAEIRIIKTARDYCVGRIERIIEPSHHRIEPDCGVFSRPIASRCGGCVFRHISYEHELELKRSFVASSFRKAGIEAEVLPVLAAGNISGYRNKAEYPVSSFGETGFYARRTHDIIPCESCSLGPFEFDGIAQIFRNWFRKTKPSGIRHLYLRRAFGTGEIMVCIVSSSRRLPESESLILELRAEFPEIKSVVLNVNSDDTNVILGKECITLFGSNTIEDVLRGMRFRISPLSFYQVNHDGAELLYGEAIKRIRSTNARRVADLYCGAGTIGICAANEIPDISLTGVEIIPDAVENACINAELNNIKNARFICQDAAAADISGYGCVIVDPPRKGMAPELVSRLIECSPEHIVYVSCNSDTLARDARALVLGGYKMSSVTPVDMFPRTGSVETVALLSRETNPLTVEVRMEVETGEVKEHPTYKRIQEYVQEKYGFKVHTAYIAEVKRIVGLDMHKAPNAVEQRKHEYHPCPPEKVEAIKDALRHFGLISE